jgi:hypothetical protein
MKAKLNHVESWTMSYDVAQYLPIDTQADQTCFNWQFYQKFEYA